MPLPKFLALVSGAITEVVATVAGGAGNADKLVATDASGRIDATLMPTGIGADTATVAASEALAAGNLVNVWNDAGTAKVRKADASTTGKEAHGFVLAVVASGANATVYFEGTDAQMTGMTPGPVYLSDTAPGGVTSAAPAGAGKIVQKVGFAVSATTLNFQAGEPVVRA